jgi:hypothetical protein
MRLFLKCRYVPSWQLLGLFLVCVSVLSACGSSENQTHMASATTATSAHNIPAITIQARDDTFQIPAKVQAGTVSITLNNDGPSPHQATVLKLHNNIDYQTLNKPWIAIQLQHSIWQMTSAASIRLVLSKAR